MFNWGKRGHQRGTSSHLPHKLPVSIFRSTNDLRLSPFLLLSYLLQWINCLPDPYPTHLHMSTGVHLLPPTKHMTPAIIALSFSIFTFSHLGHMHQHSFILAKQRKQKTPSLTPYPLSTTDNFSALLYNKISYKPCQYSWSPLALLQSPLKPPEILSLPISMGTLWAQRDGACWQCLPWQSMDQFSVLLLLNFSAVFNTVNHFLFLEICPSLSLWGTTFLILLLFQRSLFLNFLV